MKKLAQRAIEITLVFLLLIPKDICFANDRVINGPFPTSPPAGILGFSVSDSTLSSANHAKLYLWKTLWQGEEVVFAHFVALGDSFYLTSNTFVVEQGRNAFAAAFYDNQGGVVNGLLGPGFGQPTLTLKLDVMDYNNFDANQAFELCNVDWSGHGVNCVAYNLRQIFTLSYEYSVRAGTPITFNVKAGTQQKYYQFWVCSGYGTSSYGQDWQTIQGLSTMNTCDYTFNTPGHYVVVCWIKTNVNDPDYEIVGLSVEVTQ